MQTTRIDIPLENFTPNSIFAQSASNIVLSGDTYGGARALCRDTDQLVVCFASDTGFVVSSDQLGSARWLLHRNPAAPAETLYTVFHKATPEAEWTEVSHPPYRSVSTIRAVSDTEIWLAGTRSMGLSTDGGVTWTSVEAPGERSFFAERLVIDSKHTLVSHGAVLKTNDLGVSWTAQPTDGMEVVTVSDGYQLGVRDEQTYTRDSPTDEWERLEHVPTGNRALDMRHTSAGLVVLSATPAGPRQFTMTIGIRDRRGNWKTQNVQARTSALREWSIAPDGTVVLLSPSARELLVLEPSRR